jgi:hypothetical protein
MSSFFRVSRALFHPSKGRKRWAGGEFIPILAFGEEPRPVLPTIGPNGWTNKSRRTGLLFKKLDMVTIFDQWGTARAITALKVFFSLFQLLLLLYSLRCFQFIFLWLVSFLFCSLRFFRIKQPSLETTNR